jgi:glucan biosynthesis protein C
MNSLLFRKYSKPSQGFRCQSSYKESTVTTEKTAAQTTPSKPRMFYIDNLRILLTILVILHHSAIGYGGPGGFAYYEQGQISTVSTMLMTLLLSINQAFFMGFFFMISSYFSPSSVDRKGAWPYLKDRLIRLGIPLLFYILVIDPLFGYGLARYRGYPGSLREFLGLVLNDYQHLGVGPLWFVEVLLIFSIIYALWRLLFKRAAAGAAAGESKAPGNLAIAGFALVTGLLTFVVRLWLPVGTVNFFGFQFSHFVQYIAMLVIGVVAYRRNWFSGLTAAQGKFWRWIIVVFIVLFFAMFIAGGALEGNIAPFMGGLYWQAMAYALWEQFMCMAVVVTLLVWFRTRFNQQGAFTKQLSAASYATYIFHQPAIVGLMLVLSGIKLDMGLKWLLVAPVMVSACFLVGWVVKQLPLARRIV